MSEAIYPTIAVTSLIVASAMVLKTALHTFGKVRRDRHMAEIQNKLLDRLGTAPDVMTYVSSDSYRRLFEAAPTGRNEYVSRILNGLQAGLVLLLVGVAMYMMSGSAPEPKDMHGMRVLASILTAVGMGLVISTAWSQQMLRRWGLIDEKKNGTDTDAR